MARAAAIAATTAPIRSGVDTRGAWDREIQSATWPAPGNERASNRARLAWCQSNGRTIAARAAGMAAAASTVLRRASRGAIETSTGRASTAHC